MNKRLTYFIPSLLVAISLSASITACSDNSIPLQNTANTAGTIKQNNFGKVSIRLDGLAKAGSGFNTKANFTDNSITKIKIEVMGYGINPPISKTIDWNRNSTETYSILVPGGKNRIISITGMNSLNVPVATLSGLADVVTDSTTILSLNYGTTPAARVMKQILDTRSELVSKIDGEKLKRLIYNITAYNDSDGTYGANKVNPLKVDVNAISQRILSNNGDIDVNAISDFSTGVEQGNLKVYVKDKQGNPIMSGVTIKVNDITGNNAVQNGSYSTMQVDQGNWQITAKAYVNANGTTIVVPLNGDDAKNIILNGGKVLYATKSIKVTNTLEQEVILTLDTLKVKSVELYDGENRINSITSEISKPVNYDARVIYEDDSYVNDEVIWEISDNNIFGISSTGVLTGYKNGSATLTVRSILDRNKSYSYGVYVKNTGIGPIINSFDQAVTDASGNNYITIYGSNFDDLVPFNNIVKINGFKADVISVTTDSIRVKIPNSGNVGTGYITIENSKGSDTSDTKYTGGAIAISNDSAALAGGAFIMGSPNLQTKSAINTMLSVLLTEEKIRDVIFNPTIPGTLFDTVTSTTDIKDLTPGQIASLSTYTGLNLTTLNADISASASMELQAFLTLPKYHKYELMLLMSNTLNSEIQSNNTLITTIATTLQVRKDVLQNVIDSSQGAKFYDGLKNYKDSYSNINFSPSESPMIKVILSPFVMDKYEVTNKEYKSFMDGDGYNKREYWTTEGWQWKQSNNITKPLYWDDTKYNQELSPVVGVSWYESYAYAKWAGKRLPTEAEWEFAARGQSSNTTPWGKLYPWGSDVPSDTNIRANGYFGPDGSADGYKTLAPVDSFTSGVSTNGIYNLSGNVMEWASDWYQYEYYGRDNEQNNPMGPVTGDFKVVRGGSWTHGKNELTTSYRELFLNPTSRNVNLGFRCVK